MKGRPRSFDYGEASALYATGGWTRAALAHRYGVSKTAITRAVNPDYRARDNKRRDARSRSGTCERCGGACTLTARHCAVCAPFVAATTARDGELRCGTCGEWKRDRAFARDSRPRPARRGRRHRCTACETKQRRRNRRRAARAVAA